MHCAGHDTDGVRRVSATRTVFDGLVDTPPALALEAPTVAEALRGLLAVLPLYMLHDPVVVEAVTRAQAALK
jgi:hypothetical protein